VSGGGLFKPARLHAGVLLLLLLQAHVEAAFDTV
jgi:hypothetical protein